MTKQEHQEYYYNEYLTECEKIAERCEAEGYPSHGSTYEIRCADLWENYYKYECEED